MPQPCPMPRVPPVSSAVRPSSENMDGKAIAPVRLSVVENRSKSQVESLMESKTEVADTSPIMNPVFCQTLERRLQRIASSIHHIIMTEVHCRAFNMIHPIIRCRRRSLRKFSLEERCRGSEIWGSLLHSAFCLCLLPLPSAFNCDVLLSYMRHNVCTYLFIVTHPWRMSHFHFLPRD